MSASLVILSTQSWDVTIMDFTVGCYTHQLGVCYCVYCAHQLGCAIVCIVLISWGVLLCVLCSSAGGVLLCVFVKPIFEFTVVFGLVYSCIWTGLQLYLDWFTVVFGLVYSHIWTGLQLYLDWFTVVFGLVYSCI